MNPVFSKSSFESELKCSLLKELFELKNKRKDEDNLLIEIRNIVRRSLLNTKNILSNLDLYYQKEQFLDDKDIDEKFVFTLEEIEKICVMYRMNFVDAVYYRQSIPTVAEIKLEYLNDTYHKKIGGLKILSYRESFTDYTESKNYGILFAPTISGHYYLVHHWGQAVPKKRKYLYFPLRSFETLALSVIMFTLIVDLILPTHLITLDKNAGYWCGYRLGVFFHLLIFFGGFTMFFVIGFFKNVSKNIWHTV